MFVEGVIRFIAPLQGDHIARQFGHQIGILDDDIAPELHHMVANAHLAANLL